MFNDGNNHKTIWLEGKVADKTSQRSYEKPMSTHRCTPLFDISFQKAHRILSNIMERTRIIKRETEEASNKILNMRKDMHPFSTLHY